MKPPAFVDRVVIASLDGSNIPEFLVHKLAKRKFGKPFLVIAVCYTIGVGCFVNLIV